MRFNWLILVCLLFPLFAFAQNGTITGKVIRLDTKTPVAGASVFLSNATFGTSTAEDGTFTLRGVKPGQYELVVTFLGLEDYSQTILVGKDAVTVNAEMMPKVNELREVTITTGENWKKNYELFKKEFLGTDAESRNCKILNPHVINFVYHKAKQQLDAFSDEFIDIENRVTGYKVKLLLKSFMNDDINHIVSWSGKVLFTEIPARASQKQKWEAKRQDIYEGSSMHFFRSLLKNNLDKEGFVIRRLERTLNTERAQEALIVKKIDQFSGASAYNARYRDSLNYWKLQYNLPKYKDNLIRQPLNPAELVRRTNQQGLYAISFRDCLYVVYTKKHETQEFKDVYRPLDMENFETSIATLYKPYALFDLNGVLLSQSTLFEGTWSKSKLPQLLPVDYTPEEEK